MKKSLIILVLVLLGFSHAGFAQAPKEVIVIDGQVAINNGPLNPASVMVENGVLNPVPVLNVPQNAENPFLLTGFGTYCPPCGGFRYQYSAPVGTQIKLQGVSMNTNATPTFGSFEFVVFQLDGDPALAGTILGAHAINKSSANYVTKEFDHLPPVNFIEVQCNGISSSESCRFTLWGKLVNLP